MEDIKMSNARNQLNYGNDLFLNTPFPSRMEARVRPQHHH